MERKTIININAEQQNKINNGCMVKQKELIQEFFGDLPKEMAYLPSETIEEKYSRELPQQIEKKYYEYLKGVFAQIVGEDCEDVEIPIDRRHETMFRTREVQALLERAYDDAQRVTLWERLTKTNFEDVNTYKQLLREYTEELLDCMRYDFLEDLVEGRYYYTKSVQHFENESVKVPEVGC